MALPTTYRVGAITVSANGTAVTGTGTNWLAGGIRAGDIFAAKGLTATIESVDSATSLTLSAPWAGPALTAGEYEIRFTPDASRVLAASRAALVAIEETYEGSKSAIEQAQLRKNSRETSRAPLPSDDASQGYQPGSHWQWGGREWRATDTTPGAAKWRPTSTPYLTDWAAAQQAIDWLAGVGGEIVIPAGTHSMQDPLSLSKLGPLGRRAVLRGEGQSSVLDFAGGMSDAIYAGSPTVAGSGLGWDLRDFRVRGEGLDAMTGIFLEYANSARIRGVWFERMQDAIRMKDTYGVRITECHATQLGRDFLRASRTFHLILRENGCFNIGGYFVNFTTVGPYVNIQMMGNDIEVVGGVIKSLGPIQGLSYRANYMEQSSQQVFDFDGPVYGEIAGGNTLQMSGAQSIENFLGVFTANHLYDINFTWGAGSYPREVGGNFIGAQASVQRKPKRPATLSSAYVAQGSYETISYHKDLAGRVHLQGNAVRDTTAVPTLTLPHLLTTLDAGYRPSAPQTFVTQGTGNGTARIRVTVAGEVWIDSNAATDGSIALGGVTFMASTE